MRSRFAQSFLGNGLCQSLYPVSDYSGILPSGGSGSPGWEQVGAPLYAPVLKRSYNGRSSAIKIVNVGGQATNVSVYFYSDAGAVRSIGPYSLNPNAQVTLQPSAGSGSGGCDAAGTICTARITSTTGQPLAAVVQEYADSDGLNITTHNIFSAGATAIYFPVVKNQFGNMTTGLRIQNVGASSTTVTVSFYGQNGAFVCSVNGTIPAGGTFFPVP